MGTLRSAQDRWCVADKISASSAPTVWVRSCYFNVLVTDANNQQDAHQLVMQAKCRTRTQDPKPSEAAFAAVFWNFDKYRPEVADDVISSTHVEYVCMDVQVKFGDVTLNMGLIVRLVAGCSGFTYLYAVFNCRLQPTGSRWPCRIRRMYVTD